MTRDRVPGGCTPGSEFQCAVAVSHVCHCACGGKHHGKYPSLRAIRNERRLNSSESLVLLHDYQRLPEQPHERRPLNLYAKNKA